MSAPYSTTATRDANGRTILFLHIPKTAGTAIRQAVERLYAPRERLFVYDDTDLAGAVTRDQFIQLPLDQRAGLRFVMGHFAFGLHEAIPHPARYVTMLRHPVDRVASLYYHFKYLGSPLPGSREADERDLILRGDLSLEDWVFASERLEADNGMVRQLAGQPRAGFGRCTDAMLTDAMHHIDEHFDAVLIRGLMGQSVEILQGITGRVLPRLQQANANPRRRPLDEIDAEVRRRILELNRLDDRLFSAMVKRLPQTHDRWVAG